MENVKILEGLDEWVEIQSPSPSNNAQCYKDDNSVIIREDFFIDSAVFPPSNHEGLTIASPNEIQSSEVLHQFSSSSSSCSLSSNGEDVEIKDEDGSRISKALGCLRYRIVAVASKMRSYAVSKAQIWMLTLATTGLGALLFVFLLYLRVQRRRRQAKLENSKQHLMLLIKEKDQKITELLLQIARMNDVISTRRRVPIIRV